MICSDTDVKTWNLGKQTPKLKKKKLIPYLSCWIIPKATILLYISYQIQTQILQTSVQSSAVINGQLFPL